MKTILFFALLHQIVCKDPTFDVYISGKLVEENGQPVVMSDEDCQKNSPKFDQLKGKLEAWLKGVIEATLGIGYLHQYQLTNLFKIGELPYFELGANYVVTNLETHEKCMDLIAMREIEASMKKNWADIDFNLDIFAGPSDVGIKWSQLALKDGSEISEEKFEELYNGLEELKSELLSDVAQRIGSEYIDVENCHFGMYQSDDGKTWMKLVLSFKKALSGEHEDSYCIPFKQAKNVIREMRHVRWTTEVKLINIGHGENVDDDDSVHGTLANHRLNDNQKKPPHQHRAGITTFVLALSVCR